MRADLTSISSCLTCTPPLNHHDQEQLRRACDAIADMSSDDLSQLLALWLDHADAPAAQQREVHAPLLDRLVLRQRRIKAPLSDTLREQISLLHNKLGTDSPCRWRLLQWLATAGSPPDLAQFLAMLQDAPPQDSTVAALMIAPLFQARDISPEMLFPALLDGLQFPSLAAPILDLANYLFRSERISAHPAQSRCGELAELLGRLAQRLSKLEESPADSPQTWNEIRHQVDESVALVVSLCDTLALCGATQAIGKLYQTLELRHRRTRVEAAAALARLGDEPGTDVLLALIAEPSVRLRVIQAAKELGMVARLDPQFMAPEAIAEAQIAVELAQPTFFGIPPVELQLIDARTQFWPGYEAPVACFLFRYVYRFAHGEYSNVAIAGPLVHAFAADLSDLPPADIYAAYAGWHVEDEAIFDESLDDRSSTEYRELTRLTGHLNGAGYESIQWTTLAHFLGDRAFAATATRGGTPGIVVCDEQVVEWFPIRTRRNALGPFEALCIYKGRRMLRSFNPPSVSTDD